MLKHRRDEYFWFRIVVSAAAILLAILRLVLNDADRMDAAFLALVGVAVFAFVVPWDRIAHLKVGPVEFSIQETQVKAVVRGLLLEETTQEQLRDKIESLSGEIERAHGSRVLWVDDKPHEVVGARRLFRVLGVEVISATSNEEALAVLRRDNDFDLIITDVQRPGKGRDGISAIHGGVEFAAFDLPEMRDSTIDRIPLIFYAAYRMESLVKFTAPAMNRQPEPELTNRVDDLLEKAIPTLATMRSTPLKIPAEKVPT
jgi:CheY-like chemotaxis protein